MYRFIIGRPQGTLISVYRSWGRWVYISPSKNFKLSNWKYQGKSWSTLTDSNPTIRTFFGLCFPELWGREYEISRGGDR